MLPSVLAAGFVAFLAAVGPAAPTTVSAATNDVCSISGPTVMGVGQKADFTVVVQDPPDGQTISVDLDDSKGDADITSINGTPVPNTDALSGVELTLGANDCGTDDPSLYDATYAENLALIKEWLNEAIDRGENCTGPIGLQPTLCDLNAFPPDNHPNDVIAGPLLSWQDNDIDCGLTAVNGGPCEIPGYVIDLAAKSLATAVTKGTPTSCATIANDMENAILSGWEGGTNATSNYVAAQFEDFVLNYDHCSTLPGEMVVDGADGYLTVDVTCNRPGIFDLSFALPGGGGKMIEVVCSADVETADIFAIPTSVEINPAIANVAHALVWVSLKGKDGEVSLRGTKVLWTTDRCAIESSTVSDEESFEAAESLFRGFNPLVPATARAVEESTYATTGPDGASRQQEEQNTFGVTSSAASGFVQRTISATVLHCDPIHAPNVTPGPATVTAYIERGTLDDNNLANDDDLVVKTTVTVVGPPAANGVTVTAAPASLACGEKATITVDAKDAAGQPVSDHTLVEAVTNAGGVLAGTGAVAGQAGLVAPVSSTIAETFGGKATFYLLTSTAHVGKYEVVVTTGGGGGVTGQLANVRLHVEEIQFNSYRMLYSFLKR